MTTVTGSQRLLHRLESSDPAVLAQRPLLQDGCLLCKASRGKTPVQGVLSEVSAPEPVKGLFYELLRIFLDADPMSDDELIEVPQE